MPTALIFSKIVYRKDSGLTILPPGVAALFASEELGWRFVSAPGLYEPPESGVVAAFWAFDLSCGHCLDLVLLVSQNLHRRCVLFLN